MDSGVSQIVCGVVTAGFLKKLVYPKPYDTHTEYTEVKHNEINFSGLKWSFFCDFLIYDHNFNNIFWFSLWTIILQMIL